MKCIILEDNIHHQNYLEKKLLKINPNFSILKYNDYSSFQKDFESFEDGSLFFMDIVLNNDNGIEITKKLIKNIRNLLLFILQDISNLQEIYLIVNIVILYINLI